MNIKIKQPPASNVFIELIFIRFFQGFLADFGHIDWTALCIPMVQILGKGNKLKTQLQGHKQKIWGPSPTSAASSPTLTSIYALHNFK